jgi:hypothetical protein
VITLPKLNSTTAAKVEEAEGGDFEPIPEGVYPAVLDGEVEPCDGPKGLYWKWTFKLTGEDYSGRKMFLNTSLNDNALWRLKEVFEAFGVPNDTDTDDLIGKPVKLYLVQKIIGAGSRKGDMGNEIKQVLPVQQATVEPGAASAAKKKSSGAAVAQDDIPLF